MMMFAKLVLIVGCLSFYVTGSLGAEQEFKSRFCRLDVNEYVDKMKAGWIGQMAGVGWAGPTEFSHKGLIIPADKMPKWEPAMINQFIQDDLYVEMTFLRSLELYGIDVSIRQAGIDFANSSYELWHANHAGRRLLRLGIAPPDSGHPEFNKHADDIDYQIEADFAGLIAPGMPNVAIRLGETFGRLMNYGDGLYAGQFVGAMYAEAFFENDMEKIVRAGLDCIPETCQYHECISDVLKWYKQNPDDWQKTWALVEEKFHLDPEYTHNLCSPPSGKDAFSIDAKLNGAYIVMGLLYGKGDPDKTIIISTRCGQDSDCNPSNAAGVLFTTIGFEKLPDKFKSALDPEGKFSHTPYNFPKLIEVCEKLAREAVIRSGGRIEKDTGNREVFVIPVKQAKPGKLEQSWKPGPIANSKFTKEEIAKIETLITPSYEIKDFEDNFDGPTLNANWSKIDAGGIFSGGYYRINKTNKQWPPTGDGLKMTIGAGQFSSILELKGISVSGGTVEFAYRYWDADWALLISCTTTDGNDFTLSAGEWTNLAYNQRGTVNLGELSTLDFRVTWTDDAAEGKGGTWTVEYDDDSAGWKTLCMIDSSIYTQDVALDRHVEFWVNPHKVGVTANIDVDRFFIKGRKASAK